MGKKEAEEFLGVLTMISDIAKESVGTIDPEAVTDDEVNRILNYDALAEAENITKDSYKTNRDTSSLGLIMHIEHNARKNETLRQLGDTTLSNTLEDYLRVAQEEGFEIVLQLPFEGRGWGETPVTETLYILFHRAEGIFLKFDTFGGDKVNGGNFYYNWVPNNWENWQEWGHCTSSGGVSEVDGVRLWAGSHDCREALRYHLRQLRQHGTFLTPWKKSPFIWFLHYKDTDDKDYNYGAINRERIAMMPEDVQAALGDAVNQKTWKELAAEKANKGDN